MLWYQLIPSLQFFVVFVSIGSIAFFAVSLFELLTVQNHTHLFFVVIPLFLVQTLIESEFFPLLRSVCSVLLKVNVVLLLIVHFPVEAEGSYLLFLSTFFLNEKEKLSVQNQVPSILFHVIVLV